MSRMFTIQFRCDNDSFFQADEDPLRATQIEIARLLRTAADRIECGSETGLVFDTNGNRIGSFALNSD